MVLGLAPDEVLDLACAEARRRGATLQAISPYPAPLSAPAAAPGARGATPGHPAGRLDTASQRADLVVVGRHLRRLRAKRLHRQQTA